MIVKRPEKKARRAATHFHPAASERKEPQIGAIAGPKKGATGEVVSVHYIRNQMGVLYDSDAGRGGREHGSTEEEWKVITYPQRHPLPTLFL